MYKYYNAHPKNLRVNDCVKRAFSKGLEKDYNEVKKELNEIKRKVGAKTYQNNKVWKRYIKQLGLEKISFQAVKGQPRMNGHRFCKAYPKGRYILNMAHHLSVCIDGVIYDTWNCLDKCVYNAFKID